MPLVYVRLSLALHETLHRRRAVQVGPWLRLGAILETPVGSMHGRYRMVADDGEHFDAPIAPFTLAVPGLLH